MPPAAPTIAEVQDALAELKAKVAQMRHKIELVNILSTAVLPVVLKILEATSPAERIFTDPDGDQTLPRGPRVVLERVHREHGLPDKVITVLQFPKWFCTVASVTGLYYWVVEGTARVSTKSVIGLIVCLVFATLINDVQNRIARDRHSLLIKFSFIVCQVQDPDKGKEKGIGRPEPLRPGTLFGIDTNRTMANTPPGPVRTAAPPPPIRTPPRPQAQQPQRPTPPRPVSTQTLTQKPPVSAPPPLSFTTNTNIETPLPPTETVTSEPSTDSASRRRHLKPPGVPQNTEDDREELARRRREFLKAIEQANAEPTSSTTGGPAKGARMRYIHDPPMRARPAADAIPVGVEAGPSLIRPPTKSHNFNTAPVGTADAATVDATLRRPSSSTVASGAKGAGLKKRPTVMEIFNYDRLDNQDSTMATYMIRPLPTPTPGNNETPRVRFRDDLIESERKQNSLGATAASSNVPLKTAPQSSPPLTSILVPSVTSAPAAKSSGKQETWRWGDESTAAREVDRRALLIPYYNGVPARDPIKDLIAQTESSPVYQAHYHARPAPMYFAACNIIKCTYFRLNFKL